MKNYLGLDNVAILNGTYKLLRTTGEETEFIGISNYKEGLLDGEQLRFDKEGIIMSINVYRNGELIETKENIKSERYVDFVPEETQPNKRNGKYILNTHNETSIFTMKNGAFQDHKWIFYDNNSLEKPILLSIENFLDNHHIGEQVFFHEDGKIMLIEYYAELYQSFPEKSTWFDYDENGILSAEKNYRKNKKDGHHIFYTDGKITRDMSYRDGKLFGPSIYYKEDGTKLIIDYEYGFKVGERIE